MTFNLLWCFYLFCVFVFGYVVLDSTHVLYEMTRDDFDWMLYVIAAVLFGFSLYRLMNGG